MYIMSWRIPEAGNDLINVTISRAFVRSPHNRNSGEYFKDKVIR